MDAEAVVASATAPAENPYDQPSDGEQAVADVEDIATEDDANRVRPEGSQRTLREKAVIFFHQLRHKPKDKHTATLGEGQS